MTIKLPFDSDQPHQLDAVEIIVRIKTERAIVHGNRELIRFASCEKKVKKVIVWVWEGVLTVIYRIMGCP